MLHDRINIQAVAPLTREDYVPQGSTALLDAIGTGIHKIREVQHSTKEEYRAEKVLFVIITDGQENASRHYTFDMIRQRIEHQKQKYGWEFLFFGANMDAIAEAAHIGIDAGHARNYTASSAGTQAAYSAMSAMSASFRTGGTSGNGSPQQSAEEAVNNLKAAMSALKRSADEFTDTASELIRCAEANGGEIPDVNEMLRKVLEESHEDHEENHS